MNYNYILERRSNRDASAISSGAEAGGGGGGGGGMGVYIPPIIGPHPPNNYKMHPPNILNLPNLLNGDHLVLRT